MTTPATDAETRLTKAIALKPSSGMALVPVDAVTEVLDSLATLRDRFRRYAEHRDQCASYQTAQTALCDCGFSDAWYETFQEDKPFPAAACALLASLREGMRLLNEEIDTVGNERDALRAENARLRERDAQPARLGGTSN
jgi:hypothetical protein